MSGLHVSLTPSGMPVQAAAKAFYKLLLSHMNGTGSTQDGVTCCVIVQPPVMSACGGMLGFSAILSAAMRP